MLISSDERNLNKIKKLLETASQQFKELSKTLRQLDKYDLQITNVNEYHDDSNKLDHVAQGIKSYEPRMSWKVGLIEYYYNAAHEKIPVSYTSIDIDSGAGLDAYFHRDQAMDEWLKKYCPQAINNLYVIIRGVEYKLD